MTQLAQTVIGFIGAGNMGQAMITRLVAAMAPGNIIVADANNAQLEKLGKKYGIAIAPNNRDVAERASVIILAVKPDVVPQVLKEIAGTITDDKTIVSIAAGVTIAAIGSALGKDAAIVRVMPNTPALVGEGMSALSPGAFVGEKALHLTEQIFSLIGKSLVVPEKMMDTVTGLSGSGPAYVFTFIQALTDGGVKMGLPRDKALLLATQTVVGAALMVRETGEDPMLLRGRVTSPGGTTIEGIHVLERAGFSGIVMDAVEAATKKSKELGTK